MALKVTILIQAGSQYADGTAGRIGGESESWYLATSTPPTGFEDGIKALCTARAQLLPALAQVVGYRWQTITTTAGPSQSTKFYQPGQSTYASDVPQMALKIQCKSQNSANQKQMELRCIPDDQVVKGEFKPTPPFRTALQNYLNLLQQSWCFQGRDLSAQTAGIDYIEDLGIVHLLNDLGPAVGSQVQILRTTNLSGRKKGGFYTVGLVTDPKTFTLKRWDHGLCEKGKARLKGTVYPPVKFDTDAVYNATSMVKKVGRPFDLYRGRKSAKTPG